jgi:hypothetical protein
MKKPERNKHALILGLAFLAAVFNWGCNPSSRPDSGSNDKQFKDYMEFHGENPCTFRMYFQGCACGLEYPQYVVDSVLYSENSEGDFFLNKEFTLEFADPNLESTVHGQGILPFAKGRKGHNKICRDVRGTQW